MKKVTFILLLSLKASMLLAQEQEVSMDALLQEYKEESALSKQTKKDTSGLLYLYTREMLEKMQARTLKDVLKTIPGMNLYRKGNILSIAPASNMPMFVTSVRILINDHDMSSSFNGSSYLLWSDVALDYIDHIEIYKGTSSIAFGSESAPIVIKLYTKNANREIGSKVRLMLDNRGSSHASFYNAQKVNDNLSYFAYGHIDNIDNKKYHKEFNNQNYHYSSDAHTYNLYANIAYKETTIELGAKESTEDIFAGHGMRATPQDANVKRSQKYLHITQKLPQYFRVQLSLDHITYAHNSRDDNGIFIIGAPPVTHFDPHNDDNIYSVTVDKVFQNKNNKLTIGAFYKYKKFEFTKFNNAVIENALHYSSLYAEDIYLFNDNIKFVASIKENLLHYRKEIKSDNQLSYKAGINYKNDKWDTQLLYTHTYFIVPFMDYYNPFRASTTVKNLHSPESDIYLASAKYHFSKQNSLSIAVSYRSLEDPVIHNPNSGEFLNRNGYTAKYITPEMTFLHNFNHNNKFDITFYDTYNYTDKLLSPKWGINARLFNTYQKFDVYNELVYKSAYTDAMTQKHLKASYDWTAALKYHGTKDFSVGLRGENILNTGLKQAYRNTPETYPLIEQKFWLNLEYLF